MATEYRNYAFQSRANRWQDWANLILAIWLSYRRGSCNSVLSKPQMQGTGRQWR